MRLLLRQGQKNESISRLASPNVICESWQFFNFLLPKVAYLWEQNVERGAPIPQRPDVALNHVFAPWRSDTTKMDTVPPPPLRLKTIDSRKLKVYPSRNRSDAWKFAEVLHKCFSVIVSSSSFAEISAYVDQNMIENQLNDRQLLRSFVAKS